MLSLMPSFRLFPSGHPRSRWNTKAKNVIAAATVLKMTVSTLVQFLAPPRSCTSSAPCWGSSGKSPASP